MGTGTTCGPSAELAPMSGAIIGEPGRKLRVCVLHPSAEGTTGPFTEEIDGICKPDMYDPDGRYEWTNVFLKKATSTADLVRLVNSGQHDVFLNLCDGAWDEDRAGRDVVEALERLNAPYTGADAAFYEPSKIDMKKAAFFYGIQVPAWVHVQGGPGLEEVGVAEVLAPPQRGGLRFPLIVKHPSGYGSVGMTKQSKVTNEQDLRQQVSFFCREYGGALVEEFIEGREFTVLVVEEPLQGTQGAAGDCGCGEREPSLSDMVPVAYTPVECVFGPGEDFKHFDLKFINDDQIGWFPCREPELAERLKAAARDTYLATRGVSYGRCDFRVDATSGDIYFLEINPNCGVLLPPEDHGSADYILTLDPHHNHRHFLAAILASAVHRHRCKQPAVAPAFITTTTTTTTTPPPPPPPPATPQPPLPENTTTTTTSTTTTTADGAAGAPAHGLDGVGAVAAAAAPAISRSGGGSGRRLAMVALRPISAGRLVQANEHSQMTLASRSWVERMWAAGSRERRMFDEAAFPLNEQVLVMPPTDLTRWTPLTHSCDPNTQLRGLDLVARRDIGKGEVITVDFATLYGPKLSAPFDCACGAATCRGRVTADDYTLPYIDEQYGEQHLSAFVAEARRRFHQGALAAEKHRLRVVGVAGGGVSR
ncbi:hypothetical protein PLESTB_000282900 [Pleodorina starrii]|uniref:Post-SET domain-containing protein n=1 Tax=Pleodorina starrii TaxID=330485 RepID=A0A9W6BDG1_9CHLO|nr:hypothetical protein PLESTM_001406600 [Pleodorina starrii]GLC49750.1 hypothetical protein PLESTB_000282900 [Pleodorina starrii]GLC76052.1 hypothetical protein PLESTF_001724900 [Pleodorina starrii]